MSSLDTNQFTLGPVASQVRRRVSDQQWRKLVRSAHSRGFTVDSFLDTSVPAPLKARTTSSLRSQALQTVAQTYAPVEQALSDREKRISALDTKRQQDLKYYNDWLASKTLALRTTADASDQALRDTLQGVVQQNAAAYAAMPHQLEDQGRANPGNISDPTQSTAFHADVAAAGKRANDSLQAQAINAQGRIQENIDQRAMQEANNAGFMASLDAQRVAETWKSLSAVSDDRTKLLLEKGSAAAQEIARLLQGEVDKASGNRDYAAVAEKLNLQGQQFLEDVRHNKASEKTAAEIAAETARNHRANEGFRDKELDISWYNAETSRIKANKTGNGRGKGRGGTSVDPQTRFETAYAALTSARRGDGSRLSAKYVAKNRNRIIADVMSSTKVSRELARRAVDAFLRHEGADAGSFKDYGLSSASKHPHASPNAGA